MHKDPQACCLELLPMYARTLCPSSLPFLDPLWCLATALSTQQGVGKELKPHCGYHPAGMSGLGLPHRLPHVTGAGCAGGLPMAASELFGVLV